MADTNVLIDVLADDPVWFNWSFEHLEQAIRNGPVFINEVIYAEVSIRYPTIERFESALGRVGISVVPITRPALFLAGKTFLQYRRSGGTRTGVLPDFFIGAHAMIDRIPLLTRDTKRYRQYFPTIELIAPE